MKAFLKGLFILFAISFSFTACNDERDYDTIPYEVPYYEGQANITIVDFIKKYQHVADTLKITDNDVIEGYITANDVSGNIFKQLVIQDHTAAMLINIDRTGLYGDFPVGQKVVIDCKDFYIGKTYNMLQLGAYYKSGSYNQIGRADWLFVRDRIHKTGVPDPNVIKPDTLDLNTFDAGVLSNDTNVAKLYTLKAVMYQDGGQKPFATAEEVKGNAVDRIVYFVDAPDKKVTTRNSSYADFASVTLPKDTVNLTGILTTYLGAVQYMLRSYNDVQKFKGEIPQPGGTKDHPWSVDFALSNQDVQTSGWIQGYIVGTVVPGINASNPINGNEDIAFNAGDFMNNTVVLAASADVRDWTKCVVVNLPSGSAIRTQINLVDNPGNLGKVLKVTGILQNYFGAAGQYVAFGTSSEFEFGGVPSGDGDGSEASPYSANQVVAKGKDVNETGKWVKGYIVGCVPDQYLANAVFDAPFSSQSNILIATDPNETDPTNCVPVQLATGTSARTDLNLNANPGNEGKEVTIACDLIAYFGVAGIKNITSYKLNGSGPGPEPGTEILNVPFSSDMGGFTAISVLGDQVWTLNTSYGYVLMSGYANNVSNPNEDWLISPAMNLTGKTSATVTFSHTINKGTVANMLSNHTLWVSTNYTSGSPSTATWTQVTITTYPTGSDWTFVDSGNISLPSSVLNNTNVRIAFKYLCSSAESASWEIKNLVVK